jgi:ribosomal protein S27AE
MDGYFEVYEDGTVRAWVWKINRCPKCGAEIRIAEPYKEGCPKMVICGTCGYKEGFGSAETPMIVGSLECLDLQGGRCLREDSLCYLVRCPYGRHTAC